MTTPFQQIHPCCARGTFRDEMFTDPRYIFEEKLDGDRRVGQFMDDGLVRFTGRRVSDVDGLLVEKTDNVPHITRSIDPGSVACTTKRKKDPKNPDLKDQKGIDYIAAIDEALLKRAKALAGTVLDGECLVAQEFIDGLVAQGIVSGGLSKYCTSIMGSDPADAVYKQTIRGWQRWIVFDCLFYKGQDVRMFSKKERQAFAEMAVAEWGNPYVTVAPSSNGDKRKFLADILARPFGEGIIAKPLDAAYGTEKDWCKLKFEMTADCFVMGYEAPEKESKKTSGVVSVTKYHLNGWIGAIIIGQYRDGKPWQCGTISGIDEGLRAELSTNGDTYLNRVVKVTANGREPDSGKFRHPRFEEWRDDKSAKQCVYDPNES